MTDFISVFPLRYRYAERPILATLSDLTYAYGTYTHDEAKPGYISYTAQIVANQLPYWMKLRRDQTSDGWKLINSISQGLDEYLLLQDELDLGHSPDGVQYIHNSYYTANLSRKQLDSLVAEDINLLNNPEFNNLLTLLPGWKASGFTLGSWTSLACRPIISTGLLTQQASFPKIGSTFYAGAQLDPGMVLQLTLHGPDNYTIVGEARSSSLMERTILSVSPLKPVTYSELNIIGTGTILAPTVSTTTSDWVTGAAPDVYGLPAYTLRKLSGYSLGSWTLIKPVPLRYLLTNYYPTRVSPAETLRTPEYYWGSRPTESPLEEAESLVYSPFSDTGLSPYFVLLDYRGNWIRLPEDLEIKGAAAVDKAVWIVIRADQSTYLLVAPKPSPDGEVLQFVLALPLGIDFQEDADMYVGADMKQFVLRTHGGEEHVFDVHYDYYFIDDLGRAGFMEQYETIAL